MSKQAEDIRKKMKSGKASIGTWMQLANADAAEILANAGYDWVAVDLEHGAFSRAQQADLYRAIELGGAVPMARVAESSMTHIRAALDAGAKGIILPMIESAEGLQQAISHIFYPPTGRRGVGFCRANLFGQKFDQYLAGTARETLVVAQIEHINAMDHLDAIMQTPGLDAIMVGPYDLSGSMGMPGDFSNPEFEKLMNEISATCKKYKIPMGAHIVQPDTQMLQTRIEQGYLFLAYGIDTVFLAHAAALPENLLS